MKHRLTKGNFTINEKAPFQTSSNDATKIEEESFCNLMNEAYDLDNSLPVEAETVEEVPISPEAP